jgi:hypothetical protein
MGAPTTPRSDDRPASDARKAFETRGGARSIGPSDSSDSGSDLIGTGLPGDETGDRAGASDTAIDETSDRNGTGERLGTAMEPGARANADITPDRKIDASEAGLGGGLDQAEEARAGATDEELARRARRRL